MTLQENRAKAVVAGEKAARTPRFVTTAGGALTLDESSLTRAGPLVGLKGYVTNIFAGVIPAGEVLGSYHDLWQVEASFRMSNPTWLMFSDIWDEHGCDLRVYRVPPVFWGTNGF